MVDTVDATFFAAVAKAIVVVALFGVCRIVFLLLSDGKANGTKIDLKTILGFNQYE